VLALLTGRYPSEVMSVPVIRHAVIDAITAAGFTDAHLQFRVSLALTEATANAVCHAYPKDAPGRIDIQVHHTATGAIVITVTDHGVGMHAHIGPPGMGLGLPMMRTQSNNLEIESDTNGTKITLRFEDC
jgi:anti-sigma regulatory factor (Ser/Thr protein kinase)